MQTETILSEKIIGIGTDIIEIERIEKILHRHFIRFTQKIFRKSEHHLFSSFQRIASWYAVRFCAKEAAAKALGTGFSKGVTWKDFEIFNDKNGKPEIKVHGKSATIVGPQGRLITTLSHCQNYASAFVIFSKLT